MPWLEIAMARATDGSGGRSTRLDPMLVHRVLAHYPAASAWDRFHLRQRLMRCPYEALLGHLPRRGRLLDIGGGFGHFGWLLSETRPELEYWGADVDARKITLGQPGSRLRLFAGD